MSDLFPAVVDRLIASHDELGHEGTGCGCLDAVDAALEAALFCPSCGTKGAGRRAGSKLPKYDIWFTCSDCGFRFRVPQAVLRAHGDLR